jgi:hypothetical protein
MSWIPSWIRPTNTSPQRQQPQDRVDAAPTPEAPKVDTTAEIASNSTLAASDDNKHLNDGAAEVESGPMMAIPLTGFILGFGAGLYQAANRSSLVFMAENAHKRPDTVQGWYFYNKTKVREREVVEMGHMKGRKC